MDIQNILIRGPNWVGDSVLAIPAMKAVREHFRNARITLFVRPWVAGLFTSARFVDHVWSQPRPSSIADWSRITRAIRDRHFDLIGVMHRKIHAAIPQAKRIVEFAQCFADLVRAAERPVVHAAGIVSGAAHDLEAWNRMR